jgi:hypothetical protein
MESTLKNLALKFTIAASIFGASLILAPYALAVTAENSNTGADSSNDSSVSINNDVDITSNNDAEIQNNILVSANTGGNSASKNTGDGSVLTGDINGSVDISNDVNGNSLNSIGFDCSGLCTVLTNLSASNSNTGADSNNEATVEVNNDIDVTQNNNLNINNDVDADLNTGDNEADKNTGDGSVKTGDINFEVNISNEGNQNVIGGPVEDEEEPGKPSEDEPFGPAAILPSREEGKVLAVTDGLPITGGSLPIIPALLFILAGLLMKRAEEFLRFRFLPEKS